MKSRYLILSLTLGWAFLTGCERDMPYDKPITPVRVEVVHVYKAKSEFRYSADIKPDTKVDVAFKVGGYVVEILQIAGPADSGDRSRDVQEGDWVSAGSVLAQLRQSDYLAKVHLSQAGVAEAKALREQTGLDFNRDKKLLSAKNISQATYDAARARLDQADAKLSAAQATLEEAKIALADTKLTAPFDGVILDRRIEVGALAGSGSVGFTLADIDSVKAVFGVPDHRVRDMNLGETLSVTTDAVRGRVFKGHVTAIAAAADSRSRVFDTQVTVPNPEGLLKPGMIATVHLPTMYLPTDAILIPLGAVVKAAADNELYVVFVVEKQDDRDTARKRRVGLGQVIGNRVLVTEGLELGERIIVSGATLISDGEAVRVIPE